MITAYSSADYVLTFAVTLFGCIPLGISIWALLDAARRPEWAWALAGRRRIVWMFAIMFGVLSVIGGLVVSLYYLFSVRPKIAAAEDGQI